MTYPQRPPCPSSTSRRRSPARPARATPLAPDDERLAEFRPEARALPSFFVWTLGCQMNKSDSEEMAGRLLAAGCAEAPSMERPTSSSSTPARSARRPRRRSSGGRAHLEPAEGREPRPAGRDDRLLRPGVEPGRPRAALPGGGPVPAARRGAGARRPARPRLGAGAGRRVGATAATTVDGAPRSRTRPTSSGHAPTRSPVAPSAAGRAISAWLPIIYGCDKTCTYCIVPFSRGPERSRPFDEIVDEARALGRRRLPRGHAARPERQPLRPRPRARAALRARPHRAHRRPAPGPRRPARTSPS